MARIGKEERRGFARVYLKTLDPEQAAAAIGLSDGVALMGSDEIETELAKRRQILRHQLRPEDVVRRLADLAFGRCNDCVRLVLEQEPEIGKLDLSLLSEIKRNEKGTVELRLVDRLAALAQLSNLVSSDDEAADALLEALGCASEMP